MQQNNKEVSVSENQKLDNQNLENVSGGETYVVHYCPYCHQWYQGKANTCAKCGAYINCDD